MILLWVHVHLHNIKISGNTVIDISADDSMPLNCTKILRILLKVVVKI